MSVGWYVVNRRTRRMFEMGGSWGCGFDLALCCDPDALGNWLRSKVERPMPYSVWLRDMILDVTGDAPWDCEVTDDERASMLRMEDGYEKTGSYFPMDDLHEDWLRARHPDLYAVWKVMTA